MSLMDYKYQSPARRSPLYRAFTAARSTIKKRKLFAAAAGVAASALLRKWNSRTGGFHRRTTWKHKFGRPTRRAYRRRRGRGKSLKGKVRDLTRKLANNTGTKIAKDETTDEVIVPGVNQVIYKSYTGCDLTAVENELKDLKWFDPANPGVMQTVDFTAGTQSKSVRVQVRTTFNVRNNYKVPCKAIIYCVLPKEDTSIAAYTAMTQGWTDTCESANPQISRLIFPSDSKEFTQLWSIYNRREITLQPGQEVSMMYACKPFMYDPSYTDSHGSTFQKKFAGHQYVVRLHSLLMHDGTTAGQVGFGQAAVDICLQRKYTIQYPAGADITRIKFTASVPGFTGTPTISLRPQAQQATYGL